MTITCRPQLEARSFLHAIQGVARLFQAAAATGFNLQTGMLPPTRIPATSLAHNDSKMIRLAWHISLVF